MTPSTARNLFNELIYAEMAYHLSHTPISLFLKKRSKKYLGQTKREMLRVSGLGPKAKAFLDIFIEEMMEDSHV